jgi:hypothetical protein
LARLDGTTIAAIYYSITQTSGKHLMNVTFATVKYDSNGNYESLSWAPPQTYEYVLYSVFPLCFELMFLFLKERIDLITLSSVSPTQPLALPIHQRLPLCSTQRLKTRL